MKSLNAATAPSGPAYIFTRFRVPRVYDHNNAKTAIDCGRFVPVKIIKLPKRFPCNALVFQSCQSQNHRTNSAHTTWSISFELAAVASGKEPLQAERRKKPFRGLLRAYWLVLGRANTYFDFIYFALRTNWLLYLASSAKKYDESPSFRSAVATILLRD